MSALPSVLVIDDEVRSVEALERILEDDFDVKKATSIEEAEAILADEAIQVVLCDQRMPGMSGVEFLKVVRERWPDVVRMIISGYTDAEDIIQGVNEARSISTSPSPGRRTAYAASRVLVKRQWKRALAIERQMSFGRAREALACAFWASCARARGRHTLGEHPCEVCARKAIGHAEQGNRPAELIASGSPCTFS